MTNVFPKTPDVYGSASASTAALSKGLLAPYGTRLLRWICMIIPSDCKCIFKGIWPPSHGKRLPSLQPVARLLRLIAGPVLAPFADMYAPGLRVPRHRLPAEGTAEAAHPLPLPLQVTGGRMRQGKTWRRPAPDRGSGPPGPSAAAPGRRPPRSCRASFSTGYRGRPPAAAPWSLPSGLHGTHTVQRNLVDRALGAEEPEGPVAEHDGRAGEERPGSPMSTGNPEQEPRVIEPHAEQRQNGLGRGEVIHRHTAPGSRLLLHRRHG